MYWVYLPSVMCVIMRVPIHVQPQLVCQMKAYITYEWFMYIQQYLHGGWGGGGGGGGGV